MKKLRLMIVPILMLTSSGCDAQNREELKDRPDITEVTKEDPEMNAAIAAARKNIPQFLAVLSTKDDNISDIGFKYPLGGWEHIWVANVRKEGAFLVGELSNEPAQEGYKIDDTVKVPLATVSDWAYRDKNGVMQGHYTTKVLLDRIDPQEAASIKESFKW
jgi:uncharacterized protein YegJ (DUF2314 family)